MMLVLHHTALHAQHTISSWELEGTNYLSNGSHPLIRVPRRQLTVLFASEQLRVPK